MGLRPGESDCGLCRLRPLAEGGAGSCPYRGAALAINRERRDCVRFREGDYIPKKVLKVKQEESLF